MADMSRIRKLLRDELAPFKEDVKAVGDVLMRGWAGATREYSDRSGLTAPPHPDTTMVAPSQRNTTRVAPFRPGPTSFRDAYEQGGVPGMLRGANDILQAGAEEIGRGAGSLWYNPRGDAPPPKWAQGPQRPQREAGTPAAKGLPQWRDEPTWAPDALSTAPAPAAPATPSYTNPQPSPEVTGPRQLPVGNLGRQRLEWDAKLREAQRTGNASAVEHAQGMLGLIGQAEEDIGGEMRYGQFFARWPGRQLSGGLGAEATGLRWARRLAGMEGDERMRGTLAGMGVKDRLPDFGREVGTEGYRSKQLAGQTSALDQTLAQRVAAKQPERAGIDYRKLGEEALFSAQSTVGKDKRGRRTNVTIMVDGKPQKMRREDAIGVVARENYKNLLEKEHALAAGNAMVDLKRMEVEAGKEQAKEQIVFKREELRANARLEIKKLASGLLTAREANASQEAINKLKTQGDAETRKYVADAELYGKKIVAGMGITQALRTGNAALRDDMLKRHQELAEVMREKIGGMEEQVRNRLARWDDSMMNQLWLTFLGELGSKKGGGITPQEFVKMIDDVEKFGGARG